MTQPHDAVGIKAGIGTVLLHSNIEILDPRVNTSEHTICDDPPLANTCACEQRFWREQLI